MKYTAEEFRVLSDEQIEREIHDILAGKDSNLDSYFKSFRPRKYCSSPNDIMPIAEENKISIIFGYGWGAGEDVLHKAATNKDRHRESLNSNYMRAICEVFILMKQES